MNVEALSRVLRDAIAQKRIVKWGYVRQFGGLYPSECDSVAAHSNAVAALAVILATEYAERICEVSGISIDVGDVSVMGTFHDYGEGRSGDTGAASFAVRGYCNLHPLEREGLVTSLAGLKFEERALRLWDEYRRYATPEAVIVHIADNLEGLEKAFHAARGAREVVADALRISSENLQIYGDRSSVSEGLGKVAELLVREVLLPGRMLLADAYGITVENDYSIRGNGRVVTGAMEGATS